MKLAFRRLTALLLVFVLCVPLFPAAFAAELGAEKPSEDTAAPTTETVKETAEEGKQEDTPPGAEPGAPFGIEAPSADDGIMMASSTAGSIYLFDLATPYNYTISLNKQVTVKYKPNGTGSSVTAYLKNLGWHFAQYNGTAYSDQPVYCIEPHKNFAASTPGNYMDTDIPTSGGSGGRGTDVWNAMPQSYRKAIALVLAYSDQMWDRSYSVKTTSRDNNPNTALHLATQFLVYEIAMGLRNADTFEATGNGYADGDILYNAGCQISGFASNYNSLVEQVKGAMTLPSFVGSTSANAPTIDLDGDLTTVTDYNGVLPYFSFPDGSGASFSQYGNTLYIEQTGTISPSKVFSCYRNVPSADNSTVALYYGGASTYQTCVRLYNPSSGDLHGYFRLNAPPTTGNLNLVKTTEDGKNLSGWQFSIYSNSACTSLVSGPHTTNSSGKIAISGITAGNYYVKELGHKDAAINALYTCASTNPQKVTISSGGTASVSFYNKLNTSSVKLIKTTNTGNNLGGWQIGLYTDAACSSPVSGSPFTTAGDGTVVVNGLKPGTYYAKEVSAGDGYWACDTSVKTVNVTTGQTASVTFRNDHFGRIAVQKHTNTGNHLSGWTFQIRNEAGDTVAELVTDDKGYAVTGNLPLGRYLVQEKLTDDDYWQVELGLHDVTVRAGETVTDDWTNVEQGLAWVYKKTNTGESVSGWKITLYRDEACTQEVVTLVTGKDGKVGRYLNPGIYYAKETGDTEGRFGSEYWLVDERVQKLEVKPHAETSIEFTNAQYGKLKIVKTTADKSSPAGWRFKITDVSGAELSGSPFTTAADGTILTEKLLPGVYTVEELIPEDSLYYCRSKNPQTVRVIQGETAEVFFENALTPAKITITKVDIGNEPLAGAKFLLEWSEDGSVWNPVTYSESEDVVKGGCGNPNVTDGCLVSEVDGVIEWGNLHPSLRYRVTELEAPEGYVLLEDYAFEGTIPVKDHTLKLRVVNCHGFTLPDTGSNELLMFQIIAILGYIGFMVVAIVDIRRKEMRA